MHINYERRSLPKQGYFFEKIEGIDSDKIWVQEEDEATCHNMANETIGIKRIYRNRPVNCPTKSSELMIWFTERLHEITGLIANWSFFFKVIFSFRFCWLWCPIFDLAVGSLGSFMDSFKDPSSLKHNR